MNLETGVITLTTQFFQRRSLWEWVAFSHLYQCISEDKEADVWNGTGGEKAMLLRNLVGKRWIIPKIFDILNKQHDYTICFVAKPHGFCGSSLQDKIRAKEPK